MVALVAIQLAAIALLTAGDASDLLEGYYLSLLGLPLAGLPCLAGWIRSLRARRAGATGRARRVRHLAAAVWVARFVARREPACPASA